jgi:Leucine-rich repeat (LRR) protein
MDATDADLVRLDAAKGVTSIGCVVGPDNSGGPKITDVGAAHFRSLTGLEDAELFGCSELTSAVFADLAGMSQLRELRFEGRRRFRESDLKYLSGLTKLQTLTFGGAPVSDAGLDYLRGETELEDLQLGHSLITDVGVVKLLRYPRLKMLDLQGTSITDAALATVARMRNLQWLCLIDTNVTDAGIMKLASLKQLRHLYLRDSQVTDAAKKRLRSRLPSLIISSQ